MPLALKLQLEISLRFRNIFKGYACKFGNFDLADLLIDLTSCTSLASSLCMHYALSSKIEFSFKISRIIKKILNKIKNSDIVLLNQALNTKDHDDFTLLHISIQNDYYELAQILIEEYSNMINIPAGADQNLPIHLAAQNGSIRIFDLLVKHKAKISATNAKSENCLHIAANANKQEFIKHFLSVELKINSNNLCCKATNLYQFTPLMSAAFAGSLEAIKELTTTNTTYDIGYKDIDDHSIFHLCAKKNRLTCFSYLIENVLQNSEVLINVLGQKDKYDNTILHIVCFYGYYDMLTFILRKMSTNQNLIFRKNYYEQSCFHLCCKEGHDRIAK